MEYTISDKNVNGTTSVSVSDYNSLLPENMIKINLPYTEDRFETGNGEGCLAHPLTEEDAKLLDNNDTAMCVIVSVILCNDSVPYPFPASTIIQVVNSHPGSRWTMSREWVANAIQNSVKDFEPEYTLEDFLESMKDLDSI